MMSDANMTAQIVAGAQCSCCHGTEFLRGSPWHGEHVICSPCLMIWYDEGLTNSVEIGKRSLELKAAGQFPWTGRFAAPAEYEWNERYDAKWEPTT